MAYRDFTNKELEDLINGFYNGVFSPRRLPLDLYEATFDRLIDAVERGFGDFSENDVVLTDMFGNFKHNIGAFSAAKTFQQALDIETALLEGGFKVPFGQFKEKAGAIFDEYNNNWLKTEYRTAYNNTLGARQWLDLKENADIAPLLRYDTAGDERVRKEHEGLDGIVLHIDNPFWRTHFPPNGWNCRCDVTQYAEGEATPTDPSKLADLPELPSLFAFNPALEKVVFKPDAHPYFLVADRYKAQALENFGLPVPPKPAPLKPAPGKLLQRLPFEEKLKLVREKLLKSVEDYEKELGPDLLEFTSLEGKLKATAVKRRNPDELRRYFELKKKVLPARYAHEDRIVNILAQDEPLDLVIKPGSNWSKAHGDFVSRGVEAFRRIVGKKTLLNKPPKLFYNDSRNGGRAVFREETDYITAKNFGAAFVYRYDNLETVCHELGHWLEVSNTNIINGNVGFFNRRTYGQAPKRLRDLTGKDYRDDERAIEDDFFEPYSGKVYSSGHYETLTMWFTHVLGDPVEMRNFLKRDPDHFETYLRLFYENN